MNIKQLSFILLIAIASAGCLKDTQQAVSHVNDVNVSITGIWTQTKNITTYYDAADKQIYIANPPLLKLKLQFDGDKTFTRIDTSGARSSGSYTIVTQNNLDYLNFTGDAGGAHQYQLAALQSRALTLTETLNYPAGAIVTVNGVIILVGGKSLTYYKSVQVNSYIK